jgi:hypothetical protein
VERLDHRIDTLAPVHVPEEDEQEIVGPRAEARAQLREPSRRRHGQCGRSRQHGASMGGLGESGRELIEE